MTTAVRRAALGALAGAIPGIALTIVNLVAIDGEAQLTIGVAAVALAVVGAMAGVALANRPHAARTAAFALAGALPGVAAFFVPGGTRVAPLVLLAGAIAGGWMAGRATPARPGDPA